MTTTLIERIRNLDEVINRLLQSLVPLGLRLLFGYQFVVAGYGKVTHLDKITGFFTSLHIPFPGVNAVFISCLELIGGVCLILGLGTRFIAALLSATMIVALFTADSEAFSKGIDAVMAAIPFSYLVALVGLMAFGAGKISLDAIISDRIKKTL